MTNPTSNFGWQMPTSTDLVTDLPADFEVFGQAVDTSMAELKGGTTGQVLSKTSSTDMDFTWVTVTSGLTLIKTQTIGTTVSSVTVTSAFSATYDNYIITIAGGAASTTQDLNLTFGSTSAGYYWAAGRFFPAGGSASMASGNNTSSFRTTTYNAGNVTTKIEVQQPFLSKPTAYQSSSQTTGETNLYQGLLDNTTSYTAFTLTAAGGTLTGGTIRVYGYQNS
jgi:hypothetical protein